MNKIKEVMKEILTNKTLDIILKLFGYYEIIMKIIDYFHK